MESITVFSPLTTSGPVETLAQAVPGNKFVADCKKKLPLVGHVPTTFIQCLQFLLARLYSFITVKRLRPPPGQGDSTL